MQKMKAILFDLDGTLIDSMPLFRDSITYALARHGATLSHAYFMKWHAARLPWVDLLSEHAIDASHEMDVQTQSKDYFQKILRTDVTWMPGAESLLSALRKNNVPSGIVTTAFKSFVDAVSEKLLIDSLVDVIICAEDVGDKGKPNPYGLLLAADALNVKAEDSIYIGDQPFDILAANAAGMQSWLVQHPHTPADAGKEATLVLPDLFMAAAHLNLAS